jgi:hypothetical protein
MKLPRFSIRLMSYLILVFAVDLSWGMRIYRPDGIDHSYDLPFLGFFNVLAMVGYPLLARRGGRPFRVGFVVGGLFCSIAYFAAVHTFPLVSFWINFHFQLPLQQWVPYVFTLQIPGFSHRSILFDTVFGVVGMIPLIGSAMLLALLNCLVAKGKVPWMAALVGIAILVGSATLTMRRVQYQEYATRWEEVSQVLSSEAAARSKELETLKSAGAPTSIQREKFIKDQENDLARYAPAQATARHKLEIYRRVVRYPWLIVEE